MIMMIIICLDQIQNQREILVFISLQIFLQRELLYFQREQHHLTVPVKEVKNNILVVRFGRDTKKIGLEEKIYVLRLINQYKQHRNLLMHLVVGVQGKYISINRKYISDKSKVIWIWIRQLLMTFHILRMLLIVPYLSLLLLRKTVVDTLG